MCIRDRVNFPRHRSEKSQKKVEKMSLWKTAYRKMKKSLNGSNNVARKTLSYNKNNRARKNTISFFVFAQ